MADILHQLFIQASPEQVYKALTERDGLASWWTRDTVVEPVQGLTAQFGFNRRQTVFEMLIVELDPFNKVVWRCIGGPDEWLGTIVAFSLDPLKDGVTLRFSHAGWKRTDGLFAVCSFDWARYLISLKEYAASGTGTPHKG
jgi:uncharacterized protein YndB with AHSA1/START domain